MKTEGILTKEDMANNAIEWLDNLRYYKKTTKVLGQKIDGQMKYCCLGVACRVAKLENVDWKSGSHFALSRLIGLRTSEGQFMNTIQINNKPIRHLTGINDIIFINDKGFKNVTKWIKDNIDQVFIPAIAEILKKHYNK